MSENQKIKSAGFKKILPKTLFWDVDFNQLDVELNIRLIIERIASEGNLTEFISMVNYYGPDRIRKEVIFCGALDKKTISFLSLFLSISKENFQCYKKQQSTPTHWNS